MNTKQVKEFIRISQELLDATDVTGTVDAAMQTKMAKFVVPRSCQSSFLAALVCLNHHDHPRRRA